MNHTNDQREIEALIQAYLEDSLTESESARLLTRLRQDPTLANVIVQSLRTDCLIRSLVAERTLALAEVSAAHPETVIPMPLVKPGSDRSRHPTKLAAWWQASLPLAACLTLLLGLGSWYFGPTMGKPVLTEASPGRVTLERAGQTIAAAPGMPLQPGDVLITGTNAAATVTFGGEPTRVEVRAGTELQLISFADAKHFALRSGKLEASVTRQRPFKPMLLRTPQAKVRVLGTKFTLTTTTTATRLDVAEGQVQLIRASDDTQVNVPGGHYTIAPTSTALSVLPKTGGIRREIWTGIPGGEVNDLLDHPNYPNRPTQHDELKSFETPVLQTNNYACRLIGYIHPPVTGDYRFWLASGGYSALWLSPDENAIGKVRIANASGGLPRQWWEESHERNNITIARSPIIRLDAGRRYFIQALEKCATNSSHLEVAWKIPGTEREIISGDFLSPFTGKTKTKQR